MLVPPGDTGYPASSNPWRPPEERGVWNPTEASRAWAANCLIDWAFTNSNPGAEGGGAITGVGTVEACCPEDSLSPEH